VHACEATRDYRAHSHDPYYTLFRIYKRNLLASYFQVALNLRLGPPNTSGRLQVLDVGSGDAGDLDFILCRISGLWNDKSVFSRLSIHLVEDFGPRERLARGRMADLIARGGALEFDSKRADISLQLSFDEESQDLVICSEVVEHLESPERLLADIHRILKPGGFLLFTTDNEPTLFGRMKRVINRARGRHVAGEREKFLVRGEKTAVHEERVGDRLVRTMDTSTPGLPRNGNRFSVTQDSRFSGKAHTLPW